MPAWSATKRSASIGIGPKQIDTSDILRRNLRLQRSADGGGVLLKPVLGPEPPQGVVTQPLPQLGVAIQRDDVLGKARRIGAVGAKKVDTILPSGLPTQ